ncbi:hypothetical protein [Aestuariivirga litoralis]|uniref:hypothetical protein n=1 Tax=Aestuariivirga litoralis TaxID=2650924 RepID=UPI0018C7F7C8|nr:hypothetical protein [Aestuariivirga litoralis]MBG1231430.1 hypothetical protein [Aestuariivirga litoralis]
MTTKIGLLKRATLAVLLVSTVAVSPAFALRDASFLPQCPDDQMFSILNGRCVAMEFWYHAGKNNRSHRGHANTPPAPPPN